MAHAQAIGFEGIRDGVSWRRAHEELVRLAKKRAGLDFEEGRWLLRAFRTGAHVEMGLGSFNEYVERLFGYGPRFTQERLRVAEALEGLPETSRELEAGNVSFSGARELTRVAIASTEREWLEATRHRTVREVEQMVSGHRPGDRPSDAPKAEAKRHVLRFEVSGETLATFREAMAKIRRDAGESLDDDAALLLFSRHVLNGPREEGRASYQVAVTVCEECRRATQQGRGEQVEVSATAVEMAECDGQHIGHVDVATAGVHANGHVGANADAHVGAEREPTRAKQSIPPARRRTVLRRDGGTSARRASRTSASSVSSGSPRGDARRARRDLRDDVKGSSRGCVRKRFSAYAAPCVELARTLLHGRASNYGNFVGSGNEPPPRRYVTICSLSF